MKREEEIKQFCQHLVNVWDAGANRNLEALFEQAVQWADEHPQKNPWRKVEKELPSEDTEVVTYLRGTMVIGYRIGERWYMHGIAIDTPTHWMPIPQTPKGGES